MINRKTISKYIKCHEYPYFLPNTFSFPPQIAQMCRSSVPICRMTASCCSWLRQGQYLIHPLFLDNSYSNTYRFLLHLQYTFWKPSNFQHSAKCLRSCKKKTVILQHHNAQVNMLSLLLTCGNVLMTRLFGTFCAIILRAEDISIGKGLSHRKKQVTTAVCK